MSKYKIINFYEKWADDEDDTEMYRYANEDSMRIKLPFRGVLQGASGSGKTNIAMNLISGIGIWDKVIILAKNLEEKLYRCCIREIRKIETASRRNILLAIDSIADLPALKDFNPKENCLLIVDDFVADDPKSLKPLNEIWIRGRKNSISPIFISQSYFDTPKTIRKNSDYVFVKAIGNPMDMSRIAKEYALGVTPKEITALYQKTQRGRLEDFFLVDRFNQDLRYRFRDGFEPFEE